MHFNHRELTLLYDGDNVRDRKTLAYALTLSSKVNKQNLRTVDVSPTLFEMIVNHLDIPPKRLMNKADPYYQEMCRGFECKPKNWLEAMKKRPELLRAPIGMWKNKVVVCCSPTDIFKLSQAPLPQKPRHEISFPGKNL